MPRQRWPLASDRPAIELILAPAAGKPLPRTVLADTGAGSNRAGFELILDERDCLLCEGIPCQAVKLGGAYSGYDPVFLLRVQIPTLGFDHYLRAVGVPQPPAGLGGIACFRLLNRVSFGNFGDSSGFGLEL